MNLQEYFSDIRKTAAALEVAHPDGVVHVTSLYHREKNSTPGTVVSATCRNAARVIADQTHRESTPEEIRAFTAHQEAQRLRHAAAEQVNKRQYIVVVDPSKQSGGVFDDDSATAATKKPPKPAQTATA